MILRPCTINETQTHIAPQKLTVVAGACPLVHGATAVSICGVSLFNPYITASGGSGKTISPCGFIPLVSPGFHNPVERNEQVMSY